MPNEIIGKVIQVNQEFAGKSARGDWKKRDMIIETMEQYPKKVCILCFGERADQVANYQPGTEVKVAFNLESREYNGKWYSDIRAWKIDLSSGGGASNNSGNNNYSSGNNYQQAPAQSSQPSTASAPSQANDDLPF